MVVIKLHLKFALYIQPTISYPPECMVNMYVYFIHLHCNNNCILLVPLLCCACSSDLELLEFAMDTLLNLVETGDGSPEDLGVQFSEIFLKNAAHVHLVLDCLEVCVCVCV